MRCGLQRVQDSKEALLQDLAAERKQAQEREDKLSKKVVALNALKCNLQVKFFASHSDSMVV